MSNLFFHNFQHILRSRLLILVLILSFVIQWFGLRAFHSITFSFNGMETLLGQDQFLFIALFFQLFTSAFLSAIYGIWMIPYPHQGLRSQLNFVLPISKWSYPFVYAINLFCLLLLQFIEMLLVFAIVFGWSSLKAVPWEGLWTCFALEVVAFEAITFGYAVSSMSFGQVPTFFMGAAAFFLLQLGGAFFRLKNMPLLKVEFKSLDLTHKIYALLPPIGDLVFDLRRLFFHPSLKELNFALWSAWLVVFILLFRFKIRFPVKLRSTE